MGSAGRVPCKRPLSEARLAYRAGPILVASTVFAILPDHTRKPAAPTVRPVKPPGASPADASGGQRQPAAGG
jgi:hypothetical protein